MKAKQETKIAILAGYRRVLSAFLFLLLFVVSAKANPIIYTFRGIGSGGLFDGASFVDASFTFRFYADTDDVSPLILPTHPEITSIMVNCSSSSFSIAGYGDGLFTVPTVIFNNLTFGVLGFSVAVPGGLPSDVFDIRSPDFFTYGLTDSIVLFDADLAYLSLILLPTRGASGFAL